MTPFSRWERELPKLEGDKRWGGLTALTLKEKRAAFDEFCRSTAGGWVGGWGKMYNMRHENSGCGRGFVQREAEACGRMGASLRDG